MEKLPYRKHFTWLCIEGLSLDDIQKYYSNIQIAAPSKKHFDGCQEHIKSLMVTPMMIKRLQRKIYNESDLSLWIKHGYGDIYLHRMGKNDWSEVGKMLNHPVMRVALECSLVAGIPASDLSQLLPSVYYLPLSERSIEIYTAHFFDYESMGVEDWKNFLQLLAEDRYTHTRLFAALTKPREEVLHLVGLPSKVQFGNMLKNVMNTAHYRFEFYSRQSSPEAQEEARKWAKIMIDAGVKHEKFGATDATDFSNVIQTEFEYIEAPIETIAPEMLSAIKPQLNAAVGADNKAPKPPEQSGDRPANDI